MSGSSNGLAGDLVSPATGHRPESGDMRIPALQALEGRIRMMEKRNVEIDMGDELVDRDGEYGIDRLTFGGFRDGVRTSFQMASVHGREPAVAEDA